MSYTFSRRAFLKYSAATAVAVAGASLLGGCEYQDPKNPVCKTLPGAIKSDLQVIAGLKSMKIEKGTCTLEVDIESARANPIPLDPYRFSVAVKDVKDEQPVYFSDNYGGVRILDAKDPLIQQKKPITIPGSSDGPAGQRGCRPSHPRFQRGAPWPQRSRRQPRRWHRNGREPHKSPWPAHRCRAG